MEKESSSSEADRREKASLLEAARSLDAASLFAYWPRGDSGTSAATNALFGAYGAGGHLGPSSGYSGRGGNYLGSHQATPTSSGSSSAGYGSTISVAASQAASLGINPASAAWWTMASHLAAQDYLARLHGMSFAGLPGAESLYPNFLTSHSGHTSSSSTTSVKTSKTSSNVMVTSSSTKTNHTVSNSSSRDRDRDRDRGDRERERDRDNKDNYNSRERERDRSERDRDRDRDGLSTRNPVTAHSSSKTDHLASIAALANSGTSVSAVPPQAHASISDTSSILGGVRLPPDTEIIKYTSSIVGPKIPGTTNRGRKKTISLDPPNVSVTPTHSSTGLLIERGSNRRMRQLSGEVDGRDSGLDRVEVIKLPAHGSSNGVTPPSSSSCEDVPLNLCTKPRSAEDGSLEKDRISRRKPVPKQRRPTHSDTNPMSSLSAMSQIYTTDFAGISEDDNDSTQKDGRPRNLGRGISKPKKNTVASLLAQSRALGLKGPLPGDLVSQLAALKGPLPSDITSQLALLQSLASMVDDTSSTASGGDNSDKRCNTPDVGTLGSQSWNEDPKNQPKYSEDGSLTTDSTSTGSDSDNELSPAKMMKSKRKTSESEKTGFSSKNKDDLSKMKDPKAQILAMEHGRKRLQFTSQQKLHMINEIEGGKSKSDVARELGLANSTVATIWKNRKEIAKQHESSVDHSDIDKEQKRNLMAKEQLLYAQEMNKQKELLYAVELEKERRRQHMALVRALETRKRIEEREKKRLELRAEKIAKQEKKMEQRRVELELLKELRRPVEDMELEDQKLLPSLNRIPGLKLSGEAFADTLMVFEFLHNFGETLGFDMESLPTLNSLQGALLNDEESEEELLSIMTHLLVCAIEDPGIPNPARHITLLGQSLKQADITHANLSEILRIYLYANATGEVKALTGLNFERDREKKISEHHNLYGDEIQNQNTGKNAAFFEHLYENPTYKLSEELKERPFLALNPTTKSAILAFLCNELLQNKAVLRQIEGSLETVIMSRRERWILDQNIRKLRCIHDRQVKYSVNLKLDKDGMPTGLVTAPITSTPINFKHKSNEGVDTDEESSQESDHESECTQPEDDDQQQNLNAEELNKRLEKLMKQQESYVSSLRTSTEQIRATCLGQDRYWRRYWCLPKSGSVFVEGMESAQPDEYYDSEEEKELAKRKVEEDERKVVEEMTIALRKKRSQMYEKSKLCNNQSKRSKSQETTEGEDTEEDKPKEEEKDEPKRAPRKRKIGRGKYKRIKKTKVENQKIEGSKSDNDGSDLEGVGSENSNSKFENDFPNGDDGPGELPKYDSSDNKMFANNFQSEFENFNNSRQKTECDNLSNENSQESMGQDLDDSKPPVLEQMNTDFNKLRNSEVIESKMERMEDVNVKKEKDESGILDEVSGKIIIKDENKMVKLEDEDDMEKKVEVSEVKSLKFESNKTEDCNGENLDSTKDYPPPPHLHVYNETKAFSDEFKEFTEKKLSETIPNIKAAKDYLFDVKKNLDEMKYPVVDNKPFKLEDEDPLLRAMKNELSTRIFGAKMGPVKKEDSSDPYMFRNTNSPLSNGDKYSAVNTLQNNCSLLQNTEVDNEQWFSILPKESCDTNTLLLGKSEREKLSLPLYLPARGGLPPSPGPLPPCDSPAPLVLSQEEAAMLEELKTHGPRPPATPKPVPRELRRGWWRITDPDQLQSILESLHGRGVRERELKRMLSRFLDDTLEVGGKSCALKSSSEMTDLEITATDSDISKLPGGAPLRDLPGYWDRSVAQRVDNLILEQVENLEDKVANASMQIKGWKVPSRSSSIDSDTDISLKLSRSDPVDAAKYRLIDLESAIERRYLKPPLGFATGEGGVGVQVDCDESIPKGLGIWREAVIKSHTAAQLAMALYMLESCIAWDKSIMKANCQFCQSGDNEDKLLLCDGCDRGYHMYCFKPKMDSIPEGDWYCFECKNKSSGERNCIVCGKRPVKNFVLCDHCPRAYHVDCFNPPLLKVPRGKWNCNICSIKFPKKKCGRKVGWRKNKDMKTKEPDTSKDTSKDSISGNEDKTNDTTDTRLDEKSESETDNEDLPLSVSVSSKDGRDSSKECVPLSPIAASVPCASTTPNDEPPPLSPQQPTNVIRKEKISKKLCKDLNACKTLVEEMELQDEAWPFLLPVNTKQFPTYKKIIKSPMDISTIKKRLTDGLYKNKEDFVNDVRQIFNNCETFNEDDSPVGKAGHAMRSFFETRWGELINQKSTP